MTGRYKNTTTGWILIALALIWFTFIILLPLVVLVKQTFAHGFNSFITPLLNQEVRHAFKLTGIITVVAVLVNTFLGLAVSFLLARYKSKANLFLESVVNFPLAVSPVVAGFMFLLLFGREGWFAPVIEKMGLKIVFALPGMIMATIFVSLPFVIRTVVPVLKEIGVEREEAAWTLGAGWFTTFIRVTFPQIKWGVIYGMTLTAARAIGEFGAVMVVSGNIIGKTQTVTLHVNQALNDFDYQSAYSSALVLAIISFGILITIQLLHRRKMD